MGGLARWILVSTMLAGCDSPEFVEEPAAQPLRTAKKSVSPLPQRRVEVVFSDDPTRIENKLPSHPPIVYAPGDSFQGMWNYNRRNYSLRFEIVSVDHEKREIVTTLRSVDLDNVEKEFRGTVGEDGRQLFLEGVVGSGSDYEAVSGYDVRNLLRKSSNQKLDLTDCNARKLRGSTDDGTNVYFWTKVKS